MQWIADHKAIVATLASLSVIVFLGTLILIPMVVVRLPVDYFIVRKRRRHPLWQRRPLLRIAALVVKNALGIVLIVAGIAMLVLPGQGLLTIVAGLLVADFPGKFRLERWLVRRRAVIRPMNWLRARAARPPLQLPLQAGRQVPDH